MRETDPTPSVVPENRYDLLTSEPDVWNPSIGVVIPVYNHVARLRRTLTGLARQTSPPEQVVLADDGSDEDVVAVASEFSGLPITVVRQDHDGFGAGRARNLGVRSLSTDVVLFVDADCIPTDRLVEIHRQWHRKTSHLVVVGNRYHVLESDMDGVTTDQGLLKVAQSVPQDGGPDDWRGLFYRKNRRTRTGADGFRSLVSSNVSVTSATFRESGGFRESFTDWGGEDTELGWRLWNAGVTFAVADDAVVFHQVGGDETRDAREAARDRQRIVVADLVPHTFYRPGPAAFYEVPHVSIVLAVETADELLSSWFAVSRSTYPDAEIIAVGPAASVDPLLRVGPRSRMTALGDGSVADAVMASRGEFVVLVDGRVQINPKFVAKAVDEMQAAPRVSVLRGGYVQADGSVVRSLSDIDALDEELGRNGLPMLALVRRRELMKELAADASIDWKRLTDRSARGLLFEASELVDSDSVIADPSRIGVRDISTAGPRTATNAVMTVFRRWLNR